MSATTEPTPTGATRKGWTPPTLDGLGVKRLRDGAFLFPNGEKYYDDGRRHKVIAPEDVPRDLWPDPADVPGDEILVVEGRPDVVSAAELGFAAVSMPSACRMSDDQARRIAEGRARVNVIADCDPPTKQGRKRAREWATTLAQFCASFYVDLNPSREDGFDTGDVLVELGPDLGARFLRARIEGEDAEHVFPPDRLPAPSRELTAEQRERLETVVPTPSAALALLIDMANVPDEPPEYVIEPLAAKGYLTLLPGKRGSYKSFLVLLAGARCHGGGGALGELQCTDARVLYVDAENGPRLMRRRFTDAGIPPDGLLVADGTQIRLPGGLKLLRELIRATGAELVILDALRRLTPGLDEDSSRDMAPVMADLANLARDRHVAIVLLHHQSSKPNAPPSRGSSAIEDQADIVMRLRRYPGRRLKLWVGTGGKFRIDEEPAPVWLSVGNDNGVLTIGASEPAAGADDDDDPEPSAEDRLANRIRRLAEQVRTDLNGGGWAPSRLAAAVGTDTDNGTFKRALAQLVDAGEWTATGSTRSRRVRPSDSGQSGQPLRDGRNGLNQDDEQMALDEDPERGTE